MTQMQTPMGAFEPIRSYDAPGVLLDQLIDGQFSQMGDVAREVFTSDPVVAPLHRSKILDNIRQAGTGNPVTEALVNVATNPLSYLFFLTTAPGANAVGGLFKIPMRFSPFVRDHASVLETLKLSPGVASLRTTPGSAFVGQFLKGKDTLDKEFKAIVAPGLTKFVNQHGLRNTIYRDLDGPARELVREADALIQIRMEGLNKARVDWRAGIQTTTDGNNTVVSLAPTAKEVKPLVTISDAAIDARLKELGADDLLKGLTAARDQRMVRMFGKEGVKGFKPDARKIQRLYGQSGFGSQPKDILLENAAYGQQALNGLVGPEVADAVSNGTLRYSKGGKLLGDTEALEALLEDTIGIQVGSNATSYMPRNFTVMRGPQGDLLPETHARGGPTFHGLLPSKNAVARKRFNSMPFDEEDLTYLERFGEGDGLHAMRAELMEYSQQAREVGQDYMVRKLSALESMGRYNTSTANTHALFIQELDPRTLDYQKSMLARFATEGEDITGRGTLRGHPANVPSSKKTQPIAEDLSRAFQDVGEEFAPMGGFTVADGLDQTYRLLKVPQTKMFLREVIVPRMLGQSDINGAVGAALKNNAQVGVKAFLETKVADVMGEFPMGRQMVQRMGDFADSPIRSDLRSPMQYNVTSYLYGTHLGLNFSSVAANLTQPLVTTARWVPMQDLLEGYRQGFRQTFGYLKDVKKLGRLPTEQEERLLRAKNFRLSDLDGEDLLDIMDGSVGQLDYSLRQTGGLLDASTTGKLPRPERLNRFLLWPFQTAELFNRTVSGEAFAAKAFRNGSNLQDAVARSEIAEGVLESQFGSHVLNTPEAFMRQGWLTANPLIKQFLQFPTRMLVAPFTVGARAPQSGLLPPLANDMFRGVSLSAIGYEAAKGLFGWDLSRVGFAASTTQILTGVVDSEDGPLPIPPIVDLSAGALKFATFQENEFFAQTLPRAIPGGVALSRAMGVAPQIPNTSHIQPKTYADWSQMSDEGMVPVFQADGRLVQYERPSDLVLKGLGLDFGKYSTAGARDRFLVNQRDRIVEYRREYLNALLSNNIHKAQGIQQEFKKKFGFDLTVDRNQLDTAVALRRRPRVERLLDRMPASARQEYTNLVLNGTKEANLGLPKGTVRETASASQRDRHRQIQLKLEDRTKSELAEILQKVHQP